MTDKTNAERQQRYRERKKAEGLRYRWIFPSGKTKAAAKSGPLPADIRNADIETLRKTLDIARREITSLQRSCGVQVERTQLETALKSAALLVGTEAEHRTGLILKQWKIKEEQAAGVLDRKTITKLKKLKAFQESY